MVTKQIFIPLWLCLFLLLSCADGREENAFPREEELFFRSFGEDGSEELLLNAAEGMVEPWSGLALYKLSRSYLSRPVPPSLNKITRLWKKYTERYGYGDYSREVRAKITLLSGQNPAESPLLAEGEAGELYSFLFRLKKDKNPDFTPLYDYLNEETDEDNLSFLLYYLGSEGLLDDLPRPITEWLTLKLLVWEKEYGPARSKVTELETYPMVTERSGYYRDVWKVVLSHPDRTELLAQWEERQDALGGEALWSLLFHSALCRRSMTHYLTSGTLLDAALEQSVSSYQYDRTLWYRMDVWEKGGGELSQILIERASLWHDPAFYDDLVDRAVSNTVFQGQWKTLVALEEAIGQWGSPDSRDLMSWTMAQSASAGYISLSREEIDDRYRQIVEGEHGSLYTLLAEYVTAGRVDYYDRLPRGGALSDGEGNSELSLVFEGLIERNYKEASRLWYDEYASTLPLESLRTYSYFLRREGEYLESIRVMGKAGKREDFIASREDLALLYPLEYAGSIEYWCEENHLPESLFRALIKTESGYDKDIVSYAGAIGLSQLMPATAEEHMTLLGLEGGSLTEPDVNIALGTGYLRWLYDRSYINSTVQAAAAYNGGPGSVRKWNRIMESYPRLLYMEGIPFTQTRDYVKSLVKGAVVYGYLYENRPPEETLADLLPDLAG